MAESAGAHFNARELDIGMHPHQRFITVEIIQQAFRKIAGLGQHGGKSTIRMALGQHEAIPIRPLRLLGPLLEIVKIERRQ